jgi:ribonuclease Z
MGYPIGAIDGVFLTHFHSDHIDSLGEVATLRWAAGNHNSPLNVYGPEGVADIVDGFNRAYARDEVYRNDHHGDVVTPLTGAGMQAISNPVPEEGQLITVYEQDGLKVEMLVVNHFPVSPAVAYRFNYKGRTTLISGDTNKSANIERFAKGIDLLVHEALAPHLLKAMNKAATAAGQPNMATIFYDVLDYHASPVQAAETARDANVGHLLYYHIVPPLILPGSEAAWLQGVDDIFSRYTLGQDGTSFSLPAYSTEIIATGTEL